MICLADFDAAPRKHEVFRSILAPMNQEQTIIENYDSAYTPIQCGFPYDGAAGKEWTPGFQNEPG
jgi:hypothetical protein